MSEPFTIVVCRRCHGWARWQDQITGFCKTGDRWDPAASHDAKQVTLLPLDLIAPVITICRRLLDLGLIDSRYDADELEATLAALPELKAQEGGVDE